MKPCPFCGGKAHTFHNYLWHVRCDGTGGNYYCVMGFGAFVTAAEAIAAWNRRADDRIHCRDCRYYIEDKTPIDPDWPMMCYETGRDMLEPWGWCAWAERREDA